MITVYVWLPKKIGNQKNVGHSSMLVHSRTYISWWPDEPAGIGTNHHPIRNKDYISDVADEGGNPDHAIRLVGLNESRILDWWTSFGLVRDGIELEGPLPPYNLLKQNCSTVVARGLKLGGGDEYAGWYTSWSVVWRPNTLLEYAQSIQRGLAKRQAQKR